MQGSMLSKKQLETLRSVILAEAGEAVELEESNVSELCALGLVERTSETTYRLTFAGLAALQRR